MTPLPKMPEAGWRFPHATAESRSAAWGTFAQVVQTSSHLQFVVLIDEIGMK